MGLRWEENKFHPITLPSEAARNPIKVFWTSLRCVHELVPFYGAIDGHNVVVQAHRIRGSVQHPESILSNNDILGQHAIQFMHDASEITSRYISLRTFQAAPNPRAFHPPLDTSSGTSAKPSKSFLIYERFQLGLLYYEISVTLSPTRHTCVFRPPCIFPHPSCAL